MRVLVSTANLLLASFSTDGRDEATLLDVFLHLDPGPAHRAHLLARPLLDRPETADDQVRALELVVRNKVVIEREKNAVFLAVFALGRVELGELLLRRIAQSADKVRRRNLCIITLEVEPPLVTVQLEKIGHDFCGRIR